jgi:hypothetical protein
MTPSGTESILYNFQSGPSDGADPYAALAYINGKLYGTTNEGGTVCDHDNGRCGAVFSFRTIPNARRSESSVRLPKS